MTSITQTFTKLLNTIGTVADSASKVVTTTTSSLDMLEAFVSTAKQKQEARIGADMHTFYSDLQKETALENAIKAETLEKELNSNPNLKKHYDIEFNSLESVINRIKTKYNTVD